MNAANNRAQARRKGLLCAIATYLASVSAAAAAAPLPVLMVLQVLVARLSKKFDSLGAMALGICVGAQLLFEVGEEHGDHIGLGLIPGRVQPVPAVDPDGRPLRVPHIGWSALVLPPTRVAWDQSILAAVQPGDAVYFVHSYAPVPTYEAHRLADTDYHGVRICAAVARDQIYGCQFHPERSAEAGLGILGQFLSL